MSRSTRRTWLMLLPLTLGLGVAAEARHEGAYLHEVTTRLQTPHTDWATPYAPGRPRVLFIVPRTLAPREIVELWQRFDLDYAAVTIAHSGLFSFESDAGAAPYDLAVKGTSIEEKTDELLGKLAQPYDAYVMANASLDALPKQAQYEILSAVSKGAGLVFTFGRTTKLPLFKQPETAGRADITAGVPLGSLDIFAREDVRKALRVQDNKDLPSRVVETFRFGQGRLAVLQYGLGSGTYYGGQSLTPPVPYSLRWAADYECLLSLVQKTILWSTAGKRPRVTWTSLPSEGEVRPRASLPQTVPVGIQCPTALRGKLQVTVRDRTNAVEARSEVPLDLGAGENQIAVPLPVVKAGEHYLDLIVRSAAGTEQWATVALQVSDPLRLSEFAAASEFCEQGQTPTVTAKLSRPAPAGARLRLLLTDTNDRLYARREVAVAAGAQAVALPRLDLSGATTIATRVHGELWVGPELRDAADCLFFVPRRSSDKFRSVIWGVGGDTGLSWQALRQLRAAGFTDHLNHPTASGSGERLMALCDLPLVCYAYRIGFAGDENGKPTEMWVGKKIEDNSGYNPALRQEASAEVRKRIANVIPYGPSLYSLGDENYFDYDGGRSPLGQQAFRKFLQDKYGSLDQLNAAWQTTFASWDDLSLGKRDALLKQGLWPLVHEQMSYLESEYADYHHFLAAEIKDADKHAWVGAEGSVPGDLEKTIAGMEIWGPYADKRGNELLRSLSTPQLVRGNWWGGYVGSHGGRSGGSLLWHQLIGGAVNTSLFFAATGSEGLFATELSYADYFTDMLGELAEIYGGVGQLLAAGTVPDEGLAIHWAQASEHGALMFAAVGSPVSSQGNLLGLLDANGFGYRFVTTNQVTGGKLTRDRYRVLFLPCSQALSEAEAAQIKTFVEQGGTLLADVGVGAMDGNCRPLWKNASGPIAGWRGQLDDVLGIGREGEPRVKSVAASREFTLGGQPLKLGDFPYRADASVVAKGQGDLEGVPLLVTRPLGKGQVIFLNFTFPSPQHPDGPAFLRQLLAAANVRPQAWLADSRGYFSRRFAVGEMTLVGVEREAATALDTALKLSRPAYVYDVRAGKALGKTDTVALPRTAPKNRVFALLPAPAAPPTLQTAPAAKRGGRSRLALGLPKAGAAPAGRILRVQALGPDGREAMSYRAYVTLPGPTATAGVPWALSDPAGVWTLRVTDVATGLAANAKIKVQ